MKILIIILIIIGMISFFSILGLIILVIGTKKLRKKEHDIYQHTRHD